MFGTLAEGMPLHGGMMRGLADRDMGCAVGEMDDYVRNR
ncbi:hypothetical protein DSM100238_0655 [Bifidobacterium apri]|uniref:Uncharacterized protein n=1 Tax=Bifidobacterium apri TaxID=1769423 RepID=A0A6A2WEZ6_9BIFI|nr:hypothetical protein DSM100238_0655 [Bifidobacterium apri]